jgi:hypothetical protein
MQPAWIGSRKPRWDARSVLGTYRSSRYAGPACLIAPTIASTDARRTPRAIVRKGSRPTDMLALSTWARMSSGNGHQILVHHHFGKL